jgi:uncharacterized protein (TIGR02246 family)
MTRVFALLAACALIAPAAVSAQARDDDSALRANIAQWGEAYNRHDAAAVAKWYAPDAVYISPAGRVVMGSAEIQKYHEEGWKKSPTAQITIATTRVILIKPDVAMAYGTFETSGAMGPDGKPVVAKGPWVATYVMREGQWRVLTHTAAFSRP